MNDRDQRELELDLRATSDNLILAAEQAIALETQKRQLDVTSEDFRTLAVQIEVVSHDVSVLATTERRRADRLATARDPIDRPNVEAIPASPGLAGVLDRWRSAERRLAAAPPATAEAREAAREVEALRQEYARGHAELTRPTDVE